jgi:CRP-like cAMP-binding protein
MATSPEVLKRVPLFNQLNQRQLKRLAAKFKERSFPAGTTIVEQGKMSGIGFFVLVKGDATVTKDGKVVLRLGPGDHFGELALITERERHATVTAETALDCLELPAWDFRDVVKGDADIAWKLLQSVVHTLLDERDSAG